MCSRSAKDIFNERLCQTSPRKICENEPQASSEKILLSFLFAFRAIANSNEVWHYCVFTNSENAVFVALRRSRFFSNYRQDSTYYRLVFKCSNQVNFSNSTTTKKFAMLWKIWNPLSNTLINTHKQTNKNEQINNGAGRPRTKLEGKQNKNNCLVSNF